MPLSNGTRLGVYEILSPLGAGGMGEVYRARDTQLKRDVAIKVLPAAFALDPERLARFQREAEVLASLNHPNIAAIYGLVESDNTRALVLEFVEGQSPKGPMPFEDAWKIALQVAEGLEYAHERRVIHRDLKPSNLMLTPGGRVKILDFGLAKALSGEMRRPEAGPSPSPDSSTLTMGATQAGMILGTAAYMAPEQIKGKEADRRADIWAFAIVLHELLTGERPFKGKDSTEIMARAVTEEPNLDKAPLRVRRLLRECLQKEPEERLRWVGDVGRFLDQETPEPPATQPAPAAEPPATQPAPGKPRSASWLPWTAAAVLGVLALGLGWIAYRHSTETPQVIKTSLMPPPGAVYGPGSMPMISPDGRKVAVAVTADGRQGLWVRDLDSLSFRPLPGIDLAVLPFWSPDSRFLGFFTNDNKLKKIDSAGGPPITLCEAISPRGGAWNRDDVIVFSTLRGAIQRVSAAGGTASPVTELDAALQEQTHRHPWFLPDGRHFLYTAVSADAQKSAIYVGDLNSKTRQKVLAIASNAVYAPSEHILFVRERSLMVQRFDAAKMQLLGAAVPIAEQVDQAGGGGQHQFSASDTGAIVYTSGASTFGNLQLTWFDRSGKPVGTVGAAGYMQRPVISPDGSMVAVNRRDPQSLQYDVWLHDLARGSTTRFTFGPANNNGFPVWSPDGKQIAFYSNRSGQGDIYRKDASGVRPEELLDKDPRGMQPSDWTADGRYLLEETGTEIRLLPLDKAAGESKATPYLKGGFQYHNAKVSSNGQWLAFVSNESKRDEVFVVTFPTLGGKWQISTAGGSLPIWSRDGRELFFIAPDGKMMAAAVQGSGSKLQAGVPKPLFDTRMPNDGNTWYDVSKDGRFLIPTVIEQSSTVPITLVQNWPAALKTR